MNEKKYIVEEMMAILVNKAGDILFKTPVPTVIPTDSFMEDYELEDMKKIEADLGLEDIEQINKQEGKRVKISTEMSSRGEKKRNRSGKKAALK